MHACVYRKLQEEISRDSRDSRDACTSNDVEHIQCDCLAMGVKRQIEASLVACLHACGCMTTFGKHFNIRPKPLTRHLDRQNNVLCNILYLSRDIDEESVKPV